LTLRVNQSACQAVGQRQLSPRSAASSHLDCRAVLILIVALYAITQPWSNGQVEAQITKLKLVKRQMYGRAKIDLLQARLLGAA